MQKKYEYLVIGSGPAGHVAAITAAQAGLKTAIIEKDLDMIGGVCLNEGCIPAKSLYSGAYLFNEVKKYPAMFNSGTGPAQNVMKELAAKSRLASEVLKRGLLSHLKKLGVDIIEARAEFKNSSELKITTREGEISVIGADKILIATGSVPRALDGIPFDGDRIISSSDAVKLESIPEKILIIGAGAIGVEFASFFALMGAAVTLAEAENVILPSEDRDVSSAMRIILKKAGVKILTEAVIKKVLTKKDKVCAEIKAGEEDTDKNEYDIVLVSAGRIPSTDGLSLDKAGINVNERGFIPVDAAMQTNVAGIYAAGDIVPGPMLAHVAQAEGEISAFTAAGKPVKPLDYSAVPNAVYTAVQAASVGLTEKQAKETGEDIVTGKSFFKANGKAVAVGADDGFVKIVANAKTNVILGAHIVGHLAAEMIHEFAMAKRLGLKVDDIAWTVHAHPTFSESAALAAKEILRTTT